MERIKRAKKSVWAAVGWTAVGMWTVFAFYLSYQTGEQTTALSLGVAEKIARWLPEFALRYSVEEIHLWIRKAAHVMVFLLLGMAAEAAAGLSVGLSGCDYRRMALPARMMCSAVAVLTEVVKMTVPGRHLNWGEAGINVISTWMGAALVLGVRHWIRKKK